MKMLTRSTSTVAATMLAGLLFVGRPIVAVETNAPVAALAAPPVPLPKSPVDSFRELLVMPSAELMKALADRPTNQQQLIVVKIREYKSLPPEECELRLQATELRWYLLPAMETALTNRTKHLALIPERIRPMVEWRLKFWDIHPPPLQKQLLEDDRMARFYLQLEVSSPEQKTNLLSRFPQAERERLEAGYARFAAMSQDERRQTFAGFNQFFELKPDEKQKVLATLSEVGLRQMEKTLQAFDQLPRDRRELCIKSFERFASMSAIERQQFLQSARRWDKMSATDRQFWRELVSKVPSWPPMPPAPAPPVVKK